MAKVNKVRISAVIHPDYRAYLDQLAADQQLSFGQAVNEVLAAGIAARGRQSKRSATA